MAGGAIGSALRYGVVTWSGRFVPGFPLGTLLVNAVGSFIIGLLWGIAEAKDFSPAVRALLFVGILGGFTTFSSFSMETINLLRAHDMRWGIINLVLNNVLGILLAFAGLWCARLFTT